MKKILVLLVMILGLVVLFSGCVRWLEPEPGPGETEYQLEMTVEVAGQINTDDGIYYIVLDTDEDSADGPGDDISFWEDNFYYVKLDSMGFYFAQVKDDSESIFDGGSFSGNKLQVTIALSDLEDPNSVDINVLTTDLGNDTYDYLDNGYFTISTELGFKETEDDSPDDSGDGGVDYDIVNVTAEITTP